MKVIVGPVGPHVTIHTKWSSRSLGAFPFKWSRPSSRDNIVLITMFSLVSISWIISCVRRHRSNSSRSNDRSSSRRGRANWNVVSRLGKVSFSPFVPPKVVVLLSMSTLPPRFFGLREPSWTLPCVCCVSVSLSYTSSETALLIHVRFSRRIGE